MSTEGRRSGVDLADPEAYVDAERERARARRDGEPQPGFKVYVPCLTWERSYGGARNVYEREVRRELRLERDLSKVTRGGTGYVWIGHRMVDPRELLRAIAEVQDFESDNREPDRVGFEWWVEGGSGRHRFRLRAMYAGEVALEQQTTYGAQRDIYRIDDLLQALGVLGVLEADGPQTLAPPARPRPVALPDDDAEPRSGSPFVSPRIAALAGAAIFVAGFLVGVGLG